MPEQTRNSTSEPWEQYVRLLRNSVGPETSRYTVQLLETVANQTASWKDRAEALVDLIRQGNNGITEIPYTGQPIAENSAFLEEKELANALFEDLNVIYAGTDESVYLKFLEGAEDEDYVGTLWQATKAASSYNLVSSTLNNYLQHWFVLGFYSSIYELACKLITKLAQNLFATNNLSCGDARRLMAERLDGKYSRIADYFDNFLRNAISHTQYIFNDQTGLLDAWDFENGVKTAKRSYRLNDVFNKTVTLLFFIISLYVVFNERFETMLIEQYDIS